MFFDWKNQYCENDYTTQSNLQIQCNPYQITNGIFYRTRTKNLQFCMETQKTPNSQSNLEGKKDLYSENYKTLMREIKYDTDGEIYDVLGLEESTL